MVLNSPPFPMKFTPAYTQSIYYKILLNGSRLPLSSYPILNLPVFVLSAACAAQLQYFPTFYATISYLLNFSSYAAVFTAPSRPISVSGRGGHNLKRRLLTLSTQATVVARANRASTQSPLAPAARHAAGALLVHPFFLAYRQLFYNKSFPLFSPHLPSRNLRSSFFTEATFQPKSFKLHKRWLKRRSRKRGAVPSAPHLLVTSKLKRVAHSYWRSEAVRLKRLMAKEAKLDCSVSSEQSNVLLLRTLVIFRNVLVPTCQVATTLVGSGESRAAFLQKVTALWATYLSRNVKHLRQFLLRNYRFTLSPLAFWRLVAKSLVYSRRFRSLSYLSTGLGVSTRQVVGRNPGLLPLTSVGMKDRRLMLAEQLQSLKVLTRTKTKSPSRVTLPPFFAKSTLKLLLTAARPSIVSSFEEGAGFSTIPRRRLRILDKKAFFKIKKSAYPLSDFFLNSSLLRKNTKVCWPLHLKLLGRGLQRKGGANVFSTSSDNSTLGVPKRSFHVTFRKALSALVNLSVQTCLAVNFYSPSLPPTTVSLKFLAMLFFLNLRLSRRNFPQVAQATFTRYLSPKFSHFTLLDSMSWGFKDLSSKPRQFMSPRLLLRTRFSKEAKLREVCAQPLVPYCRIQYSRKFSDLKWHRGVFFIWRRWGVQRRWLVGRKRKYTRMRKRAQINSYVLEKHLSLPVGSSKRTFYNSWFFRGSGLRCEASSGVKSFLRFRSALSPSLKASTLSSALSIPSFSSQVTPLLTSLWRASSKNFDFSALNAPFARRELSLSFYSYHKTPFVLSGTGFIYLPNPLLVTPNFIRSRVHLLKYSFFNILDVKRTLLRSGGSLGASQTTPWLPLMRRRMVSSASSLGWDSSSAPLSTVSNFDGRGVSDSYLGVRETTFSSPFTQSTGSSTSKPRPFLRLKRIRFKPGYSRLWRDARKSLKKSLQLPFRYQYRLTVYLARFSRVVSNKHDQLFDLKLLHFLVRSRFVFDICTSRALLDNHLVFLNGLVTTNANLLLYKGDVVQLIVHLKFYAVHRWLLNWNFFKYYRRLKLMRSKFKKIHHSQTKQRSRRLPDWLLTSRVFDTDIPKFLEVDFFTLSSFIVYDPLFEFDLALPDLLQSRFEIYNMYNWKYLN